MAVTRKIEHAMKAFIERRLAEKLEKEKDEEKREALRLAHLPATWIADAARRARQIQLVTHAIKYSHPDARGSSLCVADGPSAAGDLVGTHTLNDKKSFDVVGNAAALDVYKFLSIEIDGIPLWKRARDEDPAFRSALPGNAQECKIWIEAFSSLTKSEETPTSHNLAKQVYWYVDDDYHLLQPLFPTTLVHEAYQIIREARFSDAARNAHQAKRESKPCAHGYRDWPDMLVQKYGGTKPQNISQLNSERHGEVWLLPSVPPQWRRSNLHPPLGVNSFFGKRQLPETLYDKSRNLGAYLVAVKDRNNKDIRLGQERRVSAIIDELIEQAMRIQLLPAGWSADADCNLPETERLWLDPRFDDEVFQQKRISTDWPRDVAGRFGNWLNARLRRYKLPMSDAEHREWRRRFEQELETLIREVANV